MIYSVSQPGSVTMPKQRYEQVAEDLRKQIGRGKKYPPGSQLPSRKELAEMYQISDTVADKAMMLLRIEGLTETLPGVGVFVAERSDG